MADRSLRGGELALWLLALLFLLAGLGRPPVSRTQEARVAEAAREMLGQQPREWLIPRLNGEIRVQKPPLAYWLGAISFAILGVNETAARLPFVLAAWLMLAIVYRIAARLFHRFTGTLAAVFLGSSFMFFRYARLAETDLLAALGVTGAIWMFLVAATATGPRRVALLHLAGVGIAIAALAKGPPAAFPLIFLACFAWVRRDRELLLDFVRSGAILTAAVLGGWWFAFVRFTPQWEVIRRELSVAAGGEDHPGPFYAYFPQLLGGIAPWSALAATGAAWMIWRSALARRIAAKFATLLKQKPPIAPAPRSDDESARTVVIWGASIFLPLCAAGNKQFHYLVPMMPPMAVAAAYAMRRAIDGEDRDRRLVRFLFCATIIVWGVSSLAAPLVARFNRGYLTGFDFLIAGLVLLLALGTWLVDRRGGLFTGVIAAGACWLLLLGIGAGWWAPSQQLSDHRTVARQIRLQFGDGPYCFYGENISYSLIYHLRAIAPRYKSPAQLDVALQCEPGLVVLAQSKNKVVPPPVPPQLLQKLELELGDEGSIIRVYRGAPTQP